jgi:hypothetical protein
MGKFHGFHQCLVNALKVVEGHLARIKVYITYHKVLIQGPLFNIVKAVGFPLSIGPANTEMRGAVFVKGLDALVKGLCQFCFTRCQ